MTKKVIIALDNKNLSEITNLVKKTKSHAFGFKIGKEFFYNYGISSQSGVSIHTVVFLVNFICMYNMAERHSSFSYRRETTQ